MSLATPVHAPTQGSLRDVLLGCLLAAPRITPAISEPDGVHAMASLLIQLDGLFDAVYESAGASPFVYGIPPWAVEVNGALDEARCGLVEQAGDWRAVGDALIRQRYVPAEMALKLELLLGTLRSEGARSYHDALGPARATPSGAAEAPLAISAQRWAELSMMIRGSDLTLREEGWRSRRVDVPVVAAGGSALISIETWFPQADEFSPNRRDGQPAVSEVPHAGDKKVAAPDFRDGVAAGHAAALRLLKAYGAPDDTLRRLEVLNFRIAEGVAPIQVQEGSAALPIALHVVQLATALAAPDVAISGQLDESGAAVPMAHADLKAKLAAIRQDGRSARLAAVPAEGATDEPHLLVLPREGLDAIAAAVWGSAWYHWTQEQVARKLSRQGHAVTWTVDGFERPGFDELLGLQLPGVVDTVDKLVSSIEASHPHTALIGGPIGSGKTWLARQVSRRLVACDEWAVVWLDITRSPLLDRAGEDELRLLLGELQRASGPRRLLVILEDLHAIEGATDLVQVAAAFEDVGASMLAVARYEKPGYADWKTGGIETTLSIGGPRLRRFASELLEARPELEAARRSIGLALELAGTSVELLVRCLEECAANPEGLHKRKLQSYVLKTAIGDEPFRAGEVEQLRILGACSVVRVTVPDELLTNVSPKRLDRLGARWHRTGRSLSSWLIGRFLLQLDSKGTEIRALSDDAFNALLARYLGVRLKHAMADDDGSAVATMLSAANATPALLSELVVDSSSALQEWSGRTRPLTIAMLLNRCDRMLEHKQVSEMTYALARRVRDSIAKLSVLELAVALKALARNRHHLLDSASDDEPGWRLVERLGRGLLSDLPACLEIDDRASVTARVSLLMHIDRFDFAVREELVCEHVPLYMRGARRDRAGDYRAILQMEELIRRTLPAEQIDNYTHRPVADVTGEGSTVAIGRAETLLLDPAITDMLEPPPDDLRDPGVYLGWLALRAKLRRNDRWDALFATVMRPLTAAIAAAQPSTVARALGHLANVGLRPLAMNLLTETAIVDALRRALHRGGASSAAILIGTVTRTRPRAAYDLLYWDEQPRHELVRSLATRIVGYNDAKGAGFALSIASAVDDLYGNPRGGFANTLATQIGSTYVQQVVRLDERTSVVFHLIRGLMLARATYLSAAVDAALDHIVFSMRHDDRPSAPDLAVAILLDEELSADQALCTRFVTRLQKELRLDMPDQSILLDRMLDAPDARSLAAYHRLADVIDADRRVQVTFAERYGSSLVDRLIKDGRPQHVTKALSAITWTLSEAQQPEASAAVFRELASRGWRWDERLADGNSIISTGQSLDLLRKASPSVARATVRSLAERPFDPRFSRDKRPRSQLQHIAHRCFSRDPLQGIDLLRSVSRLDAGCGRELLRGVQSTRRGWDWTERDIRHYANPVWAADAFLELARAGYLPSREIRDKLWTVWRPMIGQLRSPRAINQLLLAVATWDDMPERLDEAVSSINVRGMRSRIKRGSRDDLRLLTVLIGTLWTVERSDIAVELVEEASTQLLSRRLSPEPFARLLEFTNRFDTALATDLATEGALAVARAVNRPVVPRHLRHWHSTGQLLRALRLIGHAPVPFERPPTFHDIGVPAETWFLCWLPSAPWSDALLAVRLEQMEQTQMRHRSLPLARLLTVASAHGRTARVLAGPTRWDKVFGAEPDGLVSLFTQARRDPELARFIRSRRHTAAKALDRCTGRTERAQAMSFIAADALRTILAER